MRLTSSWISILALAAVLLPLYLSGASVSDINSALDLSGNISCSSGGSGWSKKKAPFTVEDVKGISAWGNYYLVASAPGKAEPQKSYSFSIQVKGAGTVFLRYKVSLDSGNDSELCAYEGSYDYGYLWGDSDYWCKGDYTAYDWWLEDGFDVGTETYTHTITFALLGPLGGEWYEAPELDKEWGEFLSKKAWLDDLSFTPDPDVSLVHFYPDVREPGEDSFVGSLEVELDTPYENVILRYTTDGSTPSSASPIYREPFTITETTTVQVMAFEGSAQTDGKVYSATYYARAAMPKITANKQVFADNVTLNFASDTEGATFFYAFGGVNPSHTGPDPSGGTTFKGSSVTLQQSLTVKVLAWRADLLDSEVAEQEFIIHLSNPVVSCQLDNCSNDLSRPFFSEQAVVSATHNLEAAVLYYRLNGGAWQNYGAPLTLTATTLVEFQAQRPGVTSSNIVAVQFIKPDQEFALPQFAPGWNLLSLPGQVSQQTANQLIEQWHPLVYDRAKRTYHQAGRLDGGQAFWVFSNPNQPLLNNGSIFLHPLPSIQLLPGYSLLGHPGSNGAALAVPGAWGWAGDRYLPKETLEQGQGAWKHSAAGEILP